MLSKKNYHDKTVSMTVIHEFFNKQENKLEIANFFRFLESDDVVEVDKGMNAEIRCNVDATPLTNSTLKWTRAEFDFGKAFDTIMSNSGSDLFFF